MKTALVRLMLMAAMGAHGLLMTSQLWANEVQPAKSAERFEAVDELLAEHVEREQIAGAVALVLHRGRVVYSTALGKRDREKEAPMTADTIFRIASMTKPVTSVAIMMLRDEGQLDLDDPLSKYLPEFAEAQVLEVDQDGQQRVVAPRHQITIRYLLTHTSGLTYSFSGPPAVTQLYSEQGVSDGLDERVATIQENVARLAKVPLVHHPGEAWQYSLSTDVLGRVVEVVSGKTLAEFFRDRIFEPLGMKDTHFNLPEEKLPRLATLYEPSEDGKLEKVGKELQREGALTYSATYPYPGSANFYSGGAGLVSTASDYARFLQMLLGGGELGGVRLLKAETVAEMTQNQIGGLSIGFGIHGDKFGYGFGVHTENSQQRNGAAIGTYSWGGIFNTYFWVDPQRELIGVIMTQLYPFHHLSLWADFQKSVYQALDEEPSAAEPH